MTAPFHPGEIVESKGSGKLHRVKKCIATANGYGVLFHGVYCRHPDGFNPDAYAPIAGTGEDGFDFRSLLRERKGA